MKEPCTWLKRAGGSRTSLVCGLAYVARLNLIESGTGQVFQLCEPRPTRAGALLNTTVTVFHIFTLHIATFQVGGVFAYKAFPPTVATVLCEPLRTLSRGLYAPPHAAAADYSRSESSVRRRPLRLWTQTGQAT